MRLSLLFLLITSLTVLAQENLETRGAFLSSRPTSTKKALVKPAKPSSDKPDYQFKGSNLGLGYSVFMKELSGSSVRVDPRTNFTTGDAIRFQFEPNIDGFIYIFNKAAGESPEMIYPDPRLQFGSNSVQAHVPIEIPSRNNPDSRLKWFVFEGEPGDEEVYVILSRKPLLDVPYAAELVKLCNQTGECPWKPPQKLWEEPWEKAPSSLGVSKDFGKRQSLSESSSIQKRIGLTKKAPAPSFVKMALEPNKDILVARITLSHK